MYNYNQLQTIILQGYDNYSKSFKSVAKTIIDQPHLAAVNNITELGHITGVSPATLLRFITQLGFSGYSDFQQVFKSNLVNQFHNYQETLSDTTSTGDDAYSLFHEICDQTNKGMSALQKTLDSDLLNNVSAKMKHANVIHLCAFRRMFPVCAYLYYTLTHIGKQARLIDGLGGLHQEQARQIQKDDMLLVISTRPYAAEAKQVCEIAKKNNTKTVVVTDSQLSPFCKYSDTVFIINDVQARNIRIPTITLSTLQALCLSLAFTTFPETVTTPT